LRGGRRREGKEEGEGKGKGNGERNERGKGEGKERGMDEGKGEGLTHSGRGPRSFSRGWWYWGKNSWLYRPAPTIRLHSGIRAVLGALQFCVFRGNLPPQFCPPLIYCCSISKAEVTGPVNIMFTNSLRKEQTAYRLKI